MAHVRGGLTSNSEAANRSERGCPQPQRLEHTGAVQKFSSRSSSQAAAAEDSRAPSAGFGREVRRCRMRVMMAEEPPAIHEEIPNDHDVRDHDREDKPGEFVLAQQFIHLDGDEERRLADGQPAGPRRAKNQADALDQREGL